MPFFDLKNAKSKLSSTSLLNTRRKSTGDILENQQNTTQNSNETKSILRASNLPEERPPTPPTSNSNITNTSISIIQDDVDEMLANRLKNISACDMELLLALETQARMDHQEEIEKRKQQEQSIVKPSKIKFDVPITPPRSKSPEKIVHTRQRRWSAPGPSPQPKRLSLTKLPRWSKLFGNTNSNENNNHHLVNNKQFNSSNNITIGSKVRLYKKPLPLVGIVKYIGKLHFDSEEWLGIELERAVGNTDGEVRGIRYFQTGTNYGIFAKKEDAIKV